MTDYRTTRLDAINEILRAGQAAPVNALTPSTPDVQIAENLLDKEWRLVLDLGWWWNTEDDAELTQNSSNEIEVPSNWIRFVPRDHRYYPKRLIIRSGKVYDLHNRTFSVGISTLIVDAVIWLAWDDLPESAKAFITARAARQFVVGDRALEAAALLNESNALAALKQHTQDKARYSMLHSHHAARVLGRAGRGPHPLTGTITST